MVSADNLNLDVLELIFAHITGNDLVSVALVSRSFFAGVIPRLYHTLGFRLSQSKKYPRVASPFAAVVSHPDFAVHVRHIDIRRVPSVNSHLHPEFIRDCTSALSTCGNLSSFTLTVDALAPFLLALQAKERLQDLRVHANISSDQAAKLFRLRGLRNLILDHASWNIVDLLPQWTRGIGSSLTSLTLYMANDLNEVVMEKTLCNLRHLTGLHIIGCGKADHVTVLQYATRFTPLLEALSFTTWENPRSLPEDLGTLPHLRHLAIDTHCSLSPSSTPTLWTSIFNKTSDWSCPLTSITLRLSERLVVGDAFIDTLLDAHETTIQQLMFVQCRLNTDSLKSICDRCTELEKLGVSVPIKEIDPFIDALTLSGSLQTLIDMGEKHMNHGPRLSLSKDTVQHLMEATSVRTVLSDSRRWIGTDDLFGVGVKLERRRLFASMHWFMVR